VTLKYFQFLGHLTRQDFSERFTGSVIGPLWALLLPLVQVALFVTIFAGLMGGRLPGGRGGTLDYALYLISGLLPWTAFSNTISRLTTVFLDKKPILAKIHLPLLLVCAPIALSEGLTLAIGMAVLLLLATSCGHASLALAAAVPAMILSQLLALALGGMLAALTVFLRDLKEVTGIVLQIWFWATPIVYVVEILPDWARPLAARNPAMLLIRPFHRAFLDGTVDSFYLALLAGTVLVAGSAARWLIRRLERDIRDSI
jgi:lipopolysaccharide transport system permease protein